MAKSKAERMREYQARKKEKLGEKEWLKKERARTKAYFKPMALLDESKQLETRENNRLNQIQFRRRKQEQKNTDVDRSNTESQPSTSTESNENEISSTTDTTITIKLPFPSRAQKGKKRTSRALSKAYRQRYDTSTSWLYFECGHGKGPCDGVGGTTKRNADNAVKQGKVLIQDAEDFLTWASKEEGGIKYQLITEQEYNHSKTEDDDRNAQIKPVKGSMKLHAMIGQGDGPLLTRNTSCACDDCFVDKFNSQSKCNWSEIAVTKRIPQVVEASPNQEDDEPEIDQTDDETTRNQSEPEPLAPTEVSEGCFVVARYDDMKYIGQVIEVCFHDNTVYINFMADSGKRKGCFKWPITEDKVWRDMADIIKVIQTPVPTTKAGRLFSVPENILKLVCDE
ncbi:hypothetical protein MAR_023394 [Mya arenaria]|uniref:Uncharacterized protein n=1 Tax=Mya arenaria TaxID=6604 RepID=A0ABY7DR05_MYAAR|nr:hypothetical protein MAR_023394 [Mya arenaria]